MMTNPAFHIAQPRTPAERARAIALINAVFPMVILALVAGALTDSDGRHASPATIVASQLATAR